MTRKAQVFPWQLRSLVQNLVMPAFEQGKLSRKNEQIKLVKENFIVHTHCTHEQVKLSARSVWKSICRGFRTEKSESKCFPVQTKQTRLIRHLLYGFWFIFFSVFSAVFVFRCCRLTYLWVSWFRFMFTLVRHSFASLIDTQLSRKATLMFHDVLLFELFHKNIPNPLIFSFKSTRKFFKTYHGPEKSLSSTHSAGTWEGFFSVPLSNQSACAIWPEKQARRYNKLE